MAFQIVYYGGAAMAMTQAQIDEFNRIRTSQNDLAAARWAEKQGIPATEYVVIMQKYPVTRDQSVTADHTYNTGTAQSRNVSQPIPITVKKISISESDKIAADTVGKSKSSRDLNTYKSGLQGYLLALNTYEPAAIMNYVESIKSIPGQQTAERIPQPAAPVSSIPLPARLPHPEEPMNPSATLANTDYNTIMTKWLQDWGVPVQHWNYWRTSIDMQVHDIYPPSLIAMGLTQQVPAAAWEANGKRHLAIKPGWLNPGVIAHEQAHNSYALLTPAQKTEFSAVYTPLKNTDPYIRLLYSINTYGLSTDVEGHAEVYRYIGHQMPVQLKQFYPKLF